MSVDTYAQFRTAMTLEEVKSALARDPALEDLGLIERSNGWLGGSGVNVAVEPWNLAPEGGDHHTIEGGFQVADLLVTIMSGFGNLEAQYRVIASLLRQVPGDVCLADRDGAGPELLRLGGTVYVDPDGYGAENLTDFYAPEPPERLVVGIPPGQAAATAAAAA